MENTGKTGIESLEKKGLVGVRGFEPPTSASQTLRANQTALHPAGASITKLYYRVKDDCTQD